MFKQICIANDIFDENSLAVKLLSDCIVKERKKERMIVDEALVRNQERKTNSKRM